MEDKIENLDKVIIYWRDSSEQNYQTMKNLMRSKDYNWALFPGHLVIEKLLSEIMPNDKRQGIRYGTDLE